MPRQGRAGPYRGRTHQPTYNVGSVNRWMGFSRPVHHAVQPVNWLAGRCAPGCFVATLSVLSSRRSEPAGQAHVTTASRCDCLFRTVRGNTRGKHGTQHCGVDRGPTGRASGTLGRPHQDVRGRPGDGARPGRYHGDLRARPVHGRHGPIGLGQVDAHALHGGPGSADVRAGVRGRAGHRHPGRRRADPAAPGPDRLRVPVLQPDPHADRGREHHPARRSGRPEGRPGMARLPDQGTGHRRPAERTVPTSCPAASSSVWPAPGP